MDQSTDREGGELAPVEGSDRIILRLIEKYSGQCSWYQLAQSNAGVDLAINGENLMTIIRNLEGLGYISQMEAENECPRNTK